MDLRDDSSSPPPLSNSESPKSSESSETRDTPKFQPLESDQMKKTIQRAYRRVRVPRHRLKQLKADWPKIVTLAVKQLGLDIQMNTKINCVEMRTSPQTLSPRSITKLANCLEAYMIGFSIEDSRSLIQLDDIYLTSFDILTVNQVLKSGNLSRAIGRVAGSNGSTKFALEAATDTRIVLNGTKVHIMGPHVNIKQATSAISRIILGKPAEKVISNLKSVMNRLNSSG